MASSSISFSQMNVQHRKPFQVERRPKLLKDFLDDNSNSCSSSGFRSPPRQQPCNPKIVSKTSFLNPDTRVARKFPKPHPSISAFQALINAVKNIPFTTVKSASFLPRSLSRRLSKRDHSRSNKSGKGKQDQEEENHEVKISVKVKDILRWTSFRDLVDEKSPNKSGKGKQDQEEENHEVKISVKVKDILRWTSFRDLVDEKSPPLDFSPSAHDHCTTTTTTTGSICSSSCNSDGSTFSWCESDLTAEFLPSWSGNSNSGEKEAEMGKKEFPFVGLDHVEATTETANCTEVDPQDRETLLYEEDEQQSPVSVFGFQFRENEEPYSAFDETLANVQRTRQNLIQKIERFESLADLEGRMSMEGIPDFDADNDEEEEKDDNEKEEEYGLVEERARELLVYVKATSSTPSFCNNGEEDQLLFDLFRDELRALKNEHSNYGDFNWDMVSVAKAWMSGEHKGFEWGLEYNKEAYIREMQKVGNWSKFEAEREELALEIGYGMLERLIDEVLADLFSKY